VSCDYQALAAPGVQKLQPYIPSVGNFISVNLGQPSGPVYQALLEQGAIVRPVANYQMPNHLRVSIGLEQENLFSLEALERVLNQLARQSDHSADGASTGPSGSALGSASGNGKASAE
jgi:histidinol-phosphate/aromatic aminotransferase/cobyric acid decarboxylase-like protein